MSPPPRHLRLLLGSAAVLALLAMLAADWNWARPMVVAYLRHTSQREIRVDDLQVRLNADWQPVVRLRGVHVANAPWAGSKPFATAEQATFTFGWSTLLQTPRLVPELHLVGADVDLQRQADGLRNWRLTRPDDRGAGRMRILRLRTERSRLQLTHRGVGLVLQTATEPVPPTPAGHTQQISFRGEFRGEAFEGRVLAGPVLSMVDTGEHFPLRGTARTGDTVLEADGRIADLLQLTGVDAQVQLRGESLAQLQAFLPRQRWPASRPYRFAAKLVRQGDDWAASEGRLQVGRSDLEGTARYTPARAREDMRGDLQATLHSKLLRMEDLPAREPLRAPATAPRAAASAASSPTRVLSRQPLPLAPLRSIDARLELTVAQLQLGTLPTVHDLKASATLQRGQLNVRLAQAQLGGGAWQGRLALNAQGGVPDVQVQLQAQGLQPTKLWPKLAQQPDVKWPALEGKLALNGHGTSIARLLASANGRLDLGLRGGSLSRRLDSRLGLDAGRMLGALVRGDAPVPIRCGAVTIAFHEGVGRSRQLVLETERTHVEGQASVHLAEESWALVLTPQPQGGVSLTVPASIVAQGTFRGLSYELAQREPVKQAERGECSG